VDRFDRTWSLFCQSFVALSRMEGVLIFPVLSAFSALLLGVAFFVPLFQLGTFQAVAHHQAGWMDYIPLFSWYYANTFVVVFFNCALVACANISLSGGQPTIGAGLAVAAARIHRIAAWTLVAATVGILLRAIEDRSDRAGKIASSILGIGWTVLTHMMVPVLVLEEGGIGKSIARSGELYRKTWGQQLAGGFAFGLINLLLALPGLSIGILLMTYDKASAVIVTVIYMLILAAVSTAVKGIFSVILYRYATLGETPQGFAQDALTPGMSY
jgi:hypothetical protein